MGNSPWGHKEPDKAEQLTTVEYWGDSWLCLFLLSNLGQVSFLSMSRFFRL